MTIHLTWSDMGVLALAIVVIVHSLYIAYLRNSLRALQQVATGAANDAKTAVNQSEDATTTAEAAARSAAYAKTQVDQIDDNLAALGQQSLVVTQMVAAIIKGEDIDIEKFQQLARSQRVQVGEPTDGSPAATGAIG